jgi:hypothetical protein
MKEFAIEEAGSRLIHLEPKAVKRETFAYDALPLASNPLALEASQLGPPLCD